MQGRRMRRAALQPRALALAVAVLLASGLGTARLAAVDEPPPRPAAPAGADAVARRAATPGTEPQAAGSGTVAPPDAETTRAAPTGVRPAFGFLDGTYAYNARDQYWEDVTRLGATILRYNLYWPEVAPTPPALDARDPGDPSYRWEQFDAWLRDAAAHDVPVLVTIWQTPPWAERDPQVGGRNSMPQLVAFRDFVAAAADRYAGDHDLDGDGPLTPLPRISRWEVWNEPNMYLFPARRAGRLTIARDYARMVEAAYAELHAVGDLHRFRQTVVVGSLARSDPERTATAPLRFLADLQDEGVPLDAVSVHPYNRYGRFGAADGAVPGSTEEPNVALGNLASLTEAVDRLWPGRELPIWVTEFGWESHPDRSQRRVSQADQARFLTQAVALLRRPELRIEAAVWFLLRDEPVVYPDGHPGWQSGLRQVDDRPKPAYEAWRDVVARPRSGDP